MINILQAEDCCGCNACGQICPQQCISMVEDAEGFLYPTINKRSCINCGKCNDICPIKNPGKKRCPISAYASKNVNEAIRLESSSGGVFTALAEEIINKNGVVFGAGFNEKWEVVHSYRESLEGLASFRGSKYVQSRVEDTYKQASGFLKNNRIVLYSGTPCQIAGLKKYLQKDYANLLTVDFICHGVPSPRVWRLYLSTLEACNFKHRKINASPCNDNLLSDILGIEFRNKTIGWREFSLAIKKRISNQEKKTIALFSEAKYKNAYLKGFLRDLYLRPACYACSFKSFKSGSDITLGDFWGIRKYLPGLDDNKGYSLVFLFSNKGEIYFHNKKILAEVLDDIVWKTNTDIYQSVKAHKNRRKFMQAINQSDDKILITRLIVKYATQSTIYSVKQYCYQIAKKLKIF